MPVRRKTTKQLIDKLDVKLGHNRLQWPHSQMRWKEPGRKQQSTRRKTR